MNPKKFWKFSDAVESDGSKLILEGVISSESWWGDEVTPELFRSELKEHEGDLTVVINSGGGDVFAGVSIYNALRDYKGNVTIRVDGLAASIASVIAMAGNEIVMSPGSVMMIHKPWTMAVGDAKELDKVKEVLNKIEDSIIPIYAERTGKTKEEISELLDAETWMTAEEAVELGFADKAEEATKKTSFSDAVKSAMSPQFSVAMKASKESLEDFMSQVAKAETTKTKEDEDVRKPEETKDPETTDNTDGGGEPEVEGGTPETEEEVETQVDGEPEAEEVVEPKAKVKKTKSTKNNKVKGKSKMNPKEKKVKDESIATDGVIAPANQADPKVGAQATATVDYLKSEASVEAFANLLKNNVGKSFSDKSVQDKWRKTLVKNGITNPDVLDLPAPLVGEIQDAIEASEIYALLNHTGLDGFKVMWDDTDPDADTSRAGQHNPDWENGDDENDKTKDQQVLTFDDRELEPDYIYKYLRLDKKTVRKNKSSGALIRFVMRELPQRIVREIERAVVIGDGRASDSKRKITSFIAVKADVVADNSFATEYQRQSGESLAESVARAKDLLKTGGVVVMVAKKGFSTEAKFEKDTNGRLLYPLGTKAEDIFDVSKVVEPDWFTDATDTAYDAYLVVFTAYKTVGDNSIESFTNFKLETNENEYLQEIYKGGGLTELKSAVGITSSVES